MLYTVSICMYFFTWSYSKEVITAVPAQQNFTMPAHKEGSKASRRQIGKRFPRIMPKSKMANIKCLHLAANGLIAVHIVTLCEAWLYPALLITHHQWRWLLPIPHYKEYVIQHLFSLLYCIETSGSRSFKSIIIH